MNPTTDIAVYVHWPFCASKCPYCDFNSHARADVDHGRWRNAYIREIAQAASDTPGRRVTSVFLGGGTPSRMEPATVAAILNGIANGWTLADDAEITLEANPNSSDAARFAEFRDAGVNRVSVGVQSFDDAALRFLGRSHDSAAARSALDAAGRIFARFSFDLISALPGQTAESWTRELRGALEFGPEHMSVYQLTIEPDTAFGRDRVAPAPEDDAVAIFEATQTILENAGLPAYEISNHARPGAESRHNLVYWTGGDYAGIGPGAHGRLTHDGTTVATRRKRDPDRWLAAAGSPPHRTPLTAEERRDELVMMGLRLRTGIERTRFRALTGMEPEAAVNADALEMLTNEGWLAVNEQGMRVRRAGRLFLNTILGKLLA